MEFIWGAWLHLGSSGLIYQNGAYYTMLQSHVRVRDNKSNLGECCVPSWVAWWHRLCSLCPIYFPFLETSLPYSRHHHQVIDDIPSTNKKANGMRKSGTRAISSMCGELPARRLDYVPPFIFDVWLNSLIITPFIHPLEPPHPSPTLVSNLAPPSGSVNPSAEERARRLKEIHQDLTLELVNAQDRQEVLANHLRAPAPNFQVGDMVWLLRRNITTTRPCAKLDYTKLGPFRISECINLVAYQLDLPLHYCIHDVFHVSLLRDKLNIGRIG